MFSFSIGGVTISDMDMFDLRVDLSPIEGAATRRTQNGTLIKWTAWQKYAVRISGEGHYLPPALAGLDYSAALEFVSPQGITESHAAATPVTTGRNFRQDGDYAPEVYGVLSDGSREVRASSITGPDTLSVTLEGDEASLAVLYFPILSVYFSPPPQTWDQYPARSGWTMTGEEI
jgi:hypothetical protein